MKKSYTQPELTVESFQVEDILFASFQGIGGDNETEIVPMEAKP